MTRVRLRPGRRKRAVDSQGTTVAAPAPAPASSSSSLLPSAEGSSLPGGRNTITFKSSSATTPVLSPDRLEPKSGEPIPAASHGAKGADGQSDDRTHATIASDKTGPSAKGAATAEAQAEVKGSIKRAGHARPTPNKQDTKAQRLGLLGRVKSIASRLGPRRGGSGSSSGSIKNEGRSSSRAPWSTGGNIGHHTKKLLSSLGIHPEFLQDSSLFGTSFLMGEGQSVLLSVSAVPFLLLAVFFLLALVSLRRRVAAAAKQQSGSSSPQKRRVTFTPAATEGNADAAAATEGLQLAKVTKWMRVLMLTSVFACLNILRTHRMLLNAEVVCSSSRRSCCCWCCCCYGHCPASSRTSGSLLHGARTKRRLLLRTTILTS